MCLFPSYFRTLSLRFQQERENERGVSPVSQERRKEKHGQRTWGLLMMMGLSLHCWLSHFFFCPSVLDARGEQDGTLVQIPLLFFSFDSFIHSSLACDKKSRKDSNSNTVISQCGPKWAKKCRFSFSLLGDKCKQSETIGTLVQLNKTQRGEGRQQWQKDR